VPPKADQLIKGKEMKELAPVAAGKQNPRWRFWLARARWYNSKNGIQEIDVPMFLVSNVSLRDADADPRPEPPPKQPPEKDKARPPDKDNPGCRTKSRWANGQPTGAGGPGSEVPLRLHAEGVDGAADDGAMTLRWMFR